MQSKSFLDKHQFHSNCELEEMFSDKATNAYEVAEPLHRFSGFIGLTSFTIDDNDGVFASRTTFFNAFCMIMYLFWTLTFAAVFVSVGKDIWKDEVIFVSDILEKSVVFTIYSFLLISLIIDWWMFLNQKKFSKIFNLLVGADKDFEVMDVDVCLKKHKKIIWIFVIMVNCVTISFLLLCTLNDHRKDVHHSVSFTLISMFLFIEFQIFIILQITFMLWAVRLRFEKLNNFLRLRLTSTESTFGDDVNITQVAKLHDKLVDVSEAINCCYGFPVHKYWKYLLEYLLSGFCFLQILVIIANNFFYLTVCIFSLIRLIFQKTTETTDIYFSGISWIIFYCAMMYSITHMGHHMTREASLLAEKKSLNFKYIGFFFISGWENCENAAQNFKRRPSWNSEQKNHDGISTIYASRSSFFMRIV